MAPLKARRSTSSPAAAWGRAGSKVNAASALAGQSPSPKVDAARQLVKRLSQAQALTAENMARRSSLGGILGDASPLASLSPGALAATLSPGGRGSIGGGGSPGDSLWSGLLPGIMAQQQAAVQEKQQARRDERRDSLYQKASAKTEERLASLEDSIKLLVSQQQQQTAALQGLHAQLSGGSSVGGAPAAAAKKK